MLIRSSPFLGTRPNPILPRTTLPCPLNSSSSVSVISNKGESGPFHECIAHAEVRPAHRYTQYGGLRPFGVSFLFAGYDPVYQFQLYATDPSGNYSGWKASCIGANSGTAQSLLRQDYKDDVDLDGALKLAVEVLSKTMDSTSLDSEKGAFEQPFACYR